MRRNLFASAPSKASASILAGLLALGTGVAITATPGCNGSSDPNGRTGPVGTQTTWALLMYAMGRNESSNAADDATKQVGAASVAANVNFEAAFSPINLLTLQFQTTRRILVNQGKQTIIEDKGQTPMAEGGELASYLGTGARIAATQRTCLVVHGHHGGPVKLIGADTAGVASLDLAALDTALTNGRAAAGLTKIDVIVLDVPHSATIEAMSVLAKHASFMVAHVGAAASTGFDYTGVLSTFGSNPSIDARALAIQIAQSISSKIPAANRQAFEAGAVAIDLSRTTAVQTELGKLGSALSADLAVPPVTNAIAAIGSARHQAVESDIELRTQVVDLGDFAARVASGNFAGISTTTVAACNTLRTAVSNALATSSVSSTTGLYSGGLRLGVYFPPNAGSLAANYSVVAASLALAAPTWSTFLTNYHTALAGRPTPTVTINSSPANLTAGQSFTVTANVSPALEIKDVTLVLTIPVNGSNTALVRVPLGPPLSSGAIAFTGSASSIGVVTSGGSLPAVLTRVANGRTVFAAFEADVRYTVSGVNVLVPGVVKVGAIAGTQTANTFVPLSWTPISPNNSAIARNDRLTQSGVTYTILPRVVTVSATGVVTATTSGGTGVLVPGNIESLLLDNAGGIASTPNQTGTLWVIAEHLNGSIGVSTANVIVN
jgi:hypothetical protein